MNAPKRWLDVDSGSSELERTILRTGLDVEIPEGAEDKIWVSLAALVPATVVGAGAALASSTASASTGAASGSGAAAVGATATSASVKVGLPALLKAFAIGAASGTLLVGGAVELTAGSGQQGNKATEQHRAVQLDGVPATRKGDAQRPAGQSSQVGAVADRQMHPQEAPRDAVPRALSAPRMVLGSEGASVDRPGSAVSASSVAAFDSPAPPGNIVTGELEASGIRASRLREEAQVLKRARDSLRRGDLAGAFAALEVARSQFQDGALGEEREALTIELLAKSGQRDAARARADAFLSAFPRSPYAARVRDFVD
jgi:hypothetical protein